MVLGMLRNIDPTPACRILESKSSIPIKQLVNKDLKIRGKKWGLRGSS